MVIPPPTCYTAPGGSITYTGNFQLLGMPLEQVALAVQLRNADGVEEMIAIEQRVIPLEAARALSCPVSH
ncbi:MAG: hypothetical protein U0694_06560 [Anaerolineae bacterium]